MNLFQQIVNKKLNNATPEDLLKLSSEHGIALTPAQAQKCAALIKGKNINIYNPAERVELIKQIAKVTSPATAQQVNALLQKLLK
ncbi:DUF2624 domain-containing protein [Ectobacillus ponti]|uniref:DUF2624 domain-containing protein n=1 Tax=Ectobacillus ponti TaxID=2961894 RepID=A0AA41X6E1_9BACI|nr:DUF2624 domain-containing protein [Ectobacillus ponti]MCP8967148.1 DUF2624 domain-containing protein [Ectobacillus ponti]